jgi:hypothetical protein
MPKQKLPFLRIMRTIELTPREEKELRRLMFEDGIDDPVNAALAILRASLNEAADINEALGVDREERDL